MIIYAVVALVFAVGATAVDLVFVMPEQQRQLASMGVPTASASSPDQYVPKLIWMMITAAFPIVVLVFMSRPNVRGYYDGAQAR